MKYFKIIVLLFFFLFVNGCSNVKDNEYVTEVVSSVDVGYSYNSEVRENEDLLISNVVVYNRNYSKFLGIKYKEYNTYGSGFVYDEDEDFYYILTNNHVVMPYEDFKINSIIVEDYFGNKYNGVVIDRDSEYDLAIVRIEKIVDLRTLEIVDNDSIIGESVKSMSNPNLRRNVINEGKINCYSIVNINDDSSNVTFDVLVHSASIQSGSSGSALLNEEDKVIGVTFAGVFDKEDNFITGYAIPATRINEFLSN